MGFVGGRLEPWFTDAPVHRACRNMVRIGIRHAESVAIAKTPVDTGDLKGAWMVSPGVQRTMTAFGIGWQGTWSNPLDYAEFVNWGTGLYGPEHRKYLIVPKVGKALHWVDAGGGDVFAAFVLHPGSEGHYMLETSANELEATWEKLVRPALRNWAREQLRANPTAVGI